MGEQAAEVAVPVFGDPTETLAMPTGVLARGEPQPTGTLASPSEGADMPHGPDQGRRGQEPNAGDLAQAPYDRVGVGEGPQVALECRDADFDGADLLAHARQHVPQVQRQQQLGVFQDRGNGLQGGARPGGQQQPVLAQDPTQGVDAGGPGLHPLLPHAMQGDERLLLDPLDRHTRHLPRPHRLEQRFGIGMVGLVAADIRPHIGGRHEGDPTAWPTAVRGRIGSPGPHRCASSPASRRCGSSASRGSRLHGPWGGSPATVSRVLRRAGLHRLNALEPAPPVRRDERAHPGELLQLDIKKLARFDQPGHRVTGNRRQCTPGAGWDYVHVCIDDHSRIGFAQISPDETGATVTAFLQAAVASFPQLGVRVTGVMTDNGAGDRSRRVAEGCTHLGLRHLYTRPYTPRTNGKAEPFLQTARREWAYARSYRTSRQRATHLTPWLHRYNWHRPHGSLNYQPPMNRLRLSRDNLLRYHI